MKQRVLPQVFFGLLPEGTPRAAAECALAEAVPCRDRLKVGAITEIKGSFVRLAAVEKRFVVLVGTDRASVEVELGLHTGRPVSGSTSRSPGDPIADRGPDLPSKGGAPDRQRRATRYLRGVALQEPLMRRKCVRGGGGSR